MTRTCQVQKGERFYGLNNFKNVFVSCGDLSSSTNRAAGISMVHYEFLTLPLAIILKDIDTTETGHSRETLANKKDTQNKASQKK